MRTANGREPSPSINACGDEAHPGGTVPLDNRCRARARPEGGESAGAASRAELNPRSSPFQIQHSGYSDRFRPHLAVHSLSRLAMTSTASDPAPLPLPLPLPASAISHAATFSTSRQLFAQHLARLVTQQETNPSADPEDLRARIADVVDQSFGASVPQPPSASSASSSSVATQQPWKLDTRRVIIEKALDDVVQESAVFPATKAQHEQLESALDLLLSFVEAGFVDENVPLTTLASLIELRPISACEPLLGYIESRVERLTRAMEYQRGRGPILLRLLNDLLRRLPRSKAGPVILSGRILMLLSSVYPLGEKSGVNLRGNFNTQKGTVWEAEEDAVSVKPVDEGVKPESETRSEEPDNHKEETERQRTDSKSSKGDKDKMEVEEGEEAEAKASSSSTPSFYSTFWSLQRYFNNPHLLFAAPGSSTSETSPLTTLYASLLTVLSTFADETRKEKELSGAGSSGTAKGKQSETMNAVELMITGEKDEADKTEQSLEQYFFPKFLTSRNLLSLELSDPTFRLQLLVQILILCQYLLSLTPANRLRAQSLPLTNTSAFPSFVLAPTFEPLVVEIERKTYAEISHMSSSSSSGAGSGGGGGGGGGGDGGPASSPTATSAVRRTIERVLERERNWTDWKLRSCLPFTKPSILEPSTSSSSSGSISDVAKAKLRSITRGPPKFPHKLGNARLSRVWNKDLKTLEGFEPDVTDDEFDSIVREWRMTKKRLGMVEKQLDQASAGLPPAKVSELQASVEPLTIKLQALHFRALRAASTEYLRHFAKIGSGDLELLLDEIDRERREREEAEERAEEDEARRTVEKELLIVRGGSGGGGGGNGASGEQGKEERGEKEEGAPQGEQRQEPHEGQEEKDDDDSKTGAIRLGDTPPVQVVRDSDDASETFDATMTTTTTTTTNQEGDREEDKRLEHGDPAGTPPRRLSAPMKEDEPGTPKRPREGSSEEEKSRGEDLDMQDGPASNKKQRI